MKGLRIPGLWAATQAYLNYRDGFIKRGLFGATVLGLGIPIQHYDVFVIVSGVTLFIFIALLALWIGLSRAARLADGAFVALFAASFCLTFFTHMIGYLEIPSGALALIALIASASRFRLTALLVTGILGVLIHENYLLTFLPLTLLPTLLKASTSEKPKRELASVAAVAGAVFAVVLLENLAPSVSAARVAKLQDTMSASVDFQPRGDVLVVLTRSVSDNLAIMRSTMGNPLWWIAQLNALLVFMPTTVLFMLASFSIIDARGQVPHARLLKAAVVLTTLCPLSLQVLGWDIYRWYALAGLSSFIAMTIVCSRYSDPAEPPLSFGKPVRNLTIALIAINMATGTGFFDSYRVDTFPFVEHWRGLVQWFQTGRHWAPPPH